MTRFALLYDAIDRTTSTNAKVAAMTEYFRSAPAADAAWAVFFLTGRRLKRLVPYAAINDWTLAATGLEAWMLEECYAVVGDGAETAALVLDQVPSIPAAELPLHRWVEDRIMRLRELDPLAQHDRVTTWWRELDRLQRFLFLKLVTGEFRVGVSQTLVVRALARAADLPATTVAARLMGEWTPSPEWYTSVLSHERTDDDLSRPYPFFLASPLDDAIETLGDPAEWLVEWKWDGIRAQLIKRAGLVHLWSRGEELITHRFPEIAAAATRLPDGTVLDGEVLAFRDGRPLPFSALQQRIGRQKQVAQLARTVPVVFMSYDVLEDGGEDIRHLTQIERRTRLEARLGAAIETSARPVSMDTEPAIAAPIDDNDEFRLTPPAASGSDAPDTYEAPHVVLRPSPIVPTMTWTDLAELRTESRARGVEGLMLKRRTSAYGVGRKRGDWWKWKIDPFAIDAVLIYAQPGSGRRASLLTDYTFGVWDEGELVPIAKAYSGLSNEEIDEMDRWIRRHTRERFGPVRHVEPVHVFELGFEAIARSTRHRSGIAVRFPRMLRWRKDKKAEDADSLDTVKRLLPAP
ncbi:MAG TPA: ATP-dependent DNA ligase [Vicinamibacterales bacterium]|nr:ATP-dependent DNA ligase [Vicinamibacterales bacterium]